MNSLPQLIAWLNDAYSMERVIAKTLENHVSDAKDFPELRERLEQHLVQTMRHADLIKGCLDELGEKPSMVKAALGTIMGKVQGATTAPFGDGLIKNFLGDYAAEHLEIASYRSLITAADELDQVEIAQVCCEILMEEESMAAWLEESIPDVTRMMLSEVARKS